MIYSILLGHWEVATDKTVELNPENSITSRTSAILFILLLVECTLLKQGWSI